MEIRFEPSGLTGELLGGETVLDAARRLGEDIVSSCAGHMVCGKCRIKAETAAAPSPEESALLSADEIASGVRLACAVRPEESLTVLVPESSRHARSLAGKTGVPGMMGSLELDPETANYYVELAEPVGSDNTSDAERLLSALEREHGLTGLAISYPVLKALPAVLRDASWKVTATINGAGQVLRVRPGYAPSVYGLAFDIGTTSVAGWLADLSSGEVVASESILNPQTAYGDDVISRISYATSNEGGGEALRRALLDGLNGMVERMAASRGIDTEDIAEAVVVGNTAMHHLFFGLPAAALGSFPFTPAISEAAGFSAADTGLRMNPSGRVFSPPLLGGFTGADCAAAVLAARLWEREGSVLLVDIGTNGEIVLGSDKGLFCASCATGPAFEGARIRHGMRAEEGAISKVIVDPDTLEASCSVIGALPRGICGSGIVDAAAGMYMAGIIGRSGSFKKGLDSPRIRQAGDGGMEYVVAWAGETATGRDITVSQADVRAVQFAKAAISAGIKALMREAAVEQIDEVFLAGAFGNFIDKRSAKAVGLLPPIDLDMVTGAGNAAGEGALAALLSRGRRDEARRLPRMVRHVELSVNPFFQEAYIASLDFPEI